MKYLGWLNLLLLLRVLKKVLHVRYSPGFWCALIPEYTRVVNILGFWICQVYTRLWIKYLMVGFDIMLNMPWVLNMPGFLINMPEFRIKFPITDTWQGSEYVSSSEYASVPQCSIEIGSSCMFDRVLRIWIIDMLWIW